MHGIIYIYFQSHINILVNKSTNITKVDTPVETRIYTAQTIVTFNDSIYQICWDEVYASRDPQDNYCIFLNEILLAYNNSFPLVKKIPGQENINHGLLQDLKIPLELNTNCTCIT